MERHALDAGDPDPILDRELQLVREAIQLVATGGSRRVVLAGIRFGAEDAGLAALDARRAGVRLRLMPGARPSERDIAVERDGRG